MKIRLTSVMFFLALFVSSTLFAQIKEYNHASIISFEEEIKPATTHGNSHLSLSEKHFKHGERSLHWKWESADASLHFSKNIAYRKNNPFNDNSVSSFVFWLYSPQAYKGASLRFSFYKEGRLCSSFDYGLDFKGWSGAWLSFDRDMEGVAEEDMDELIITVEGAEEGELYFDHIMFAPFLDVRHHTADFQAPYINFGTTSHWLVLLESWNKNFDLPLTTAISASDISDIETLEERLQSLLLANSRSSNLLKLRERFEKYKIHSNSDGTVTGIPLFFERFGETYERLGAPRYNKIYANEMGLRTFNRLLFDLAVSYNNLEQSPERDEIGSMYIELTKYMLDQGFRAGSAMGTLHHLGYSMRQYYSASFLMRNLLHEKGLASEVQRAMEWFAGTGEVKLAPSVKGMDVDAFNTTLLPRLSSVLLLENSPEKLRYLQAFVRWVDNGFEYSEGTLGTFKIDGTMFHHRHNYPAYAVGGLKGATNAAWLFHKTRFALKKESKEVLKEALLAMRYYTNLRVWPLSLSGRHPDGEGHLFPEHFAILALSGTPDESESIDRDLAAAYLRLIDGEQTKYATLFKEKGIKAEKSPEGNRTFPYSSLSVHRRNDWMVSAMGHSRYLWATETYVGANLYGRYLNHGNLQILASGGPISNFGSGFKQEGWDWNHFPGTTAAELPIADLRSDIKNLDENSGYEEMLLSDEAFAGGISIADSDGAYAMKLHEHDKYNGSLRAHKSYFFFDNRVVALGSNVKSDLPGSEVHTTLFQIYRPAQTADISLNRKPVRDFPVRIGSKKKLNEISDGLNNYFFVRNGDVQLRRTVQHSFHEETDVPTENPFSLAYINHGEKAKVQNYEYLLLVQPDKFDLKAARKGIVSKRNPLYSVLQQDSLAHIVYDKTSKTTAYVFFEAGSYLDKQRFVVTNLPVLVMSKVEDKGTLRLSVADPDLRFYEGEVDEVFDEKGKRIERSVYSRTWIDNPSKASKVELTIGGEWLMRSDSDYFNIKGYVNGNTVLEVDCQHGLTREIQLIQK